MLGKYNVWNSSQLLGGEVVASTSVSARRVFFDRTKLEKSPMSLLFWVSNQFSSPDAENVLPSSNVWAMFSLTVLCGVYIDLDIETLKMATQRKRLNSFWGSMGMCTSGALAPFADFYTKDKRMGKEKKSSHWRPQQQMCDPNLVLFVSWWSKWTRSSAIVFSRNTILCFLPLSVLLWSSPMMTFKWKFRCICEEDIVNSIRTSLWKQTRKTEAWPVRFETCVLCVRFASIKNRIHHKLMIAVHTRSAAD